MMKYARSITFWAYFSQDGVPLPAFSLAFSFVFGAGKPPPDKKMKLPLGLW